VSGQGSPTKGDDTENSLTSTTSDFAEQSLFDNLSVVSSEKTALTGFLLISDGIQDQKQIRTYDQSVMSVTVLHF